MKVLFVFLAIVVGLVLAHNYVQTGEIGFATSLSDTEREIRRLDERLTDASRAYRVAGRGSAFGGVEGTSGAESVLGDVRAVEREMNQLRQRVGTESERERFAALEQHLREVKGDLSIE